VQQTRLQLRSQHVDESELAFGSSLQLLERLRQKWAEAACKQHACIGWQYRSSGFGDTSAVKRALSGGSSSGSGRSGGWQQQQQRQKRREQQLAAT